MNKSILAVVLVAFGALTAYTWLHHGGLLEWLAYYTREPASWQIFADLVITMSLLLVCIHRDAQATGRRFWPWAVFCLTVGSFGPLLYFLTGRRQA